MIAFNFQEKSKKGEYKRPFFKIKSIDQTTYPKMGKLIQVGTHMHVHV